MIATVKEFLSRGEPLHFGSEAPPVLGDLTTLRASLEAIAQVAPASAPPIAIKCDVHEKCRTPSECTRVGSCLDAPKRHVANLAKLEADLNRNPLDEIASALRALTYGEMMELAEAIWKTKPESDITQDALPMMLHKWSTGQS